MNLGYEDKDHPDYQCKGCFTSTHDVLGISKEAVAAYEAEWSKIEEENRDLLEEIRKQLVLPANQNLEDTIQS